MGRQAMMKDVRRQMRRAMGEDAVKQVEGQTEVLGLHHQRLESLRDITIGLDREYAKLYEALVELSKAHDIDNRRISDLVRRADKSDRETCDLWAARRELDCSLWKRLKWLIAPS